MLTKATYSMIQGAYINVLDYMTDAQKADVLSYSGGTVDVTAAVQAAIDASFASGAGLNNIVYFPAGRYLITNTIDLHYGTKLEGVNINYSGFAGATSWPNAQSDSQGSVILFRPVSELDLFLPVLPKGGSTAWTGIAIKNLNIWGNTTPNAYWRGVLGGSFAADVSFSRYAIDFREVTAGTVENVSIIGFQYGIVEGSYTQYNVYNQVNIQFIRFACYYIPALTITNEPTSPTFTNCVFRTCQHIAETVFDPANSFSGSNLQIRFTNCYFENTSSHGFILTAESREWSFVNCYAEAIGLDATVADRSCFYVGVGGSPYTLKALTIFGGQYAGDDSAASIFLNTDATDGVDLYGVDVKRFGIGVKSTTNTRNRAIYLSNPYFQSVTTLFDASTVGKIIGTYRTIDTSSGSDVVVVNTEYLTWSGDLQITAPTIRLGDGSSTNIRPGADNTMSCGTASARWSEIFAGNGTINTSDEREKTFLTIEDAERAAALEIKSSLRKFKFNSAVEKKGDAARIHFGVAAQQVGSIMVTHGLDPNKYGFFCYDNWEQTVDADGNVALEAGNRYGIRYEELLCFIMAAI
jgi:hypothetical protein